MYEVITLKGGSLNSTCLHKTNDLWFVRKTISTNSNREYGYVRWYSQLKKIQRYNNLFPGLVPKLLDVSIDSKGDAYFDIEYINAKDIKTLFKDNSLLTNQIDKMHDALWYAFDQIHSVEYKPNVNSLKLYFVEEVEQKLKDALNFEEFNNFFNLDNYHYNEEIFSGLKNTIVHEKFKKLFDIKIDQEGYVHGNPTLENILYSPENDKITFIDLYEEGIVDSKFMDYSQILQCSNSYYGIMNDSPKVISGNTVLSLSVIPSSLDYFNKIFKSRIFNQYGDEKIKLVDLFEATQFLRMLPFKCHAGDFNSAKFFYAHACYLVNKII